MATAEAPGVSFRLHAARAASEYEEIWATSPEYPIRVCSLIASALELAPEHRLADVGCGRGTYAARLREFATLVPDVLCVDPYAPDLAALPARGFRPIVATAEQFVAQAHRYDRLLLKEVVHHIGDIQAFFAGIARHLSPGGRFVVVMWPPTLDHYPLFAAVREHFRRRQPYFVDIASAADGAGFSTRVAHNRVPLTFARDRWLGMVARRYMSLLSACTDQELAEGIAELRQRFGTNATLDVEDHLVFIIGILRD